MFLLNCQSVGVLYACSLSEDVLSGHSGAWGVHKPLRHTFLKSNHSIGIQDLS